MAGRRKPKTWIEIAVANGGWRKGSKALLWAYTWAIVREALGRDPSVDDVAEWWNEPRRTAFREQAAFRECFPDLDNPAPLYADPAQLDRIRTVVDATRDLDAAKRAKQRPSDLTILQLGLSNPAP